MVSRWTWRTRRRNYGNGRSVSRCPRTNHRGARMLPAHITPGASSGAGSTEPLGVWLPSIDPTEWLGLAIMDGHELLKLLG